MKTALLLAMTLLLGNRVFSQSLTGLWDTGKENTKVEVTEENGFYQGAIHSSGNSKATIGKVIVKAGKVRNKSHFVGKIYALKKDKWYDAEFYPEGNKLTLKVSSGWNTKTQEWVRVE